VLGVPARVARPLSGEEIANITAIRDRYVALKDEYRSLLIQEADVGRRDGGRSEA
jgi:carbonic anhydrase/acetyltransferase-like protein (isoleucine patch superfamily)